MFCRGIRGATTVGEDTPTAIEEATRQLLEALAVANPSLAPADVAAVWFTSSPDIRSAYPATAARHMGWTDVPLMCAQEIPVPGGLAGCIRLLIFWNTPLSQQQIRHVYLREAVRLRPDLARPVEQSQDEEVST